MSVCNISGCVYFAIESSSRCLKMSFQTDALKDFKEIMCSVEINIKYDFNLI